MTNASSPNNASVYGLIDWLLLSGISVEVGEISAYDSLQKRLAEKNVLIETVQEPAKSASGIKPALSSSVNIKQFDSIEELHKFCGEFRDFSLAKTASCAVTGAGSIAPLLYIVTDMPEDEEDRTGLAFTSPANLLVRKALSFTDIPADRIYFSYLSKWRSPGKRSLSPPEMELCKNLLQQEIRLLDPAFILALGETTKEVVIKQGNINENIKIPFGKTQTLQMLNKNRVFLTSQKPEFLIKNPAMKKNFWFGLLELADLIRADGRSQQHNPGVNNVEKNSDVTE